MNNERPTGDKLITKLAQMACMAAQKAYAPYSGFHVGAAVLCESGNIYTGCNIENASYPAGICAERTAAAKAVSEGERRITAVAIAGGMGGKAVEYCPPCGICRQFLAEFSDPTQTKIILAKCIEEKIFVEEYTLSDLLPLSFTQDKLI